MNYFKKPYIPPLREELHVEEITFLEEYVEVKEENIEIFEEISEGLVIEEEPKIKIVEEINKDPIIEKIFQTEIIETIKEEIVEEVVNDLDEVKLDDYNVQGSIISVGDIETNFIDFIGVERFDLIIDYCGVKEFGHPSSLYNKPKAHAEEEEMPEGERRKSKLPRSIAEDDPVLGQPRS